MSLFLLSAPTPGRAAVTLDTVADTGPVHCTASPCNYTHTLGASASFIAIWTACGQSPTSSGITSVSVGGTAATRSVGTTSPAARLDLWYLPSPPTGAQTVSIVWVTATCQSLIAESISMTGTHPSNPLRATSVFSARGYFSLNSIDALPGDFVLEGICAGAALSAPTLTQRFLRNIDANTSCKNIGAQSALGPGTIAGKWAVAEFLPGQPDQFNSIMVALQPVSPTAGVVLDGLAADRDLQLPGEALSANWSGFADLNSGIASYAWAIGTTPGGTDVQGFTDVGLAPSATASAQTQAGATYFSTVRATSGSTLTVSATSDGVKVAALGIPCTGASSCADGVCAQGVCCDRTCVEKDEVCARAEGAPLDGICALQPARLRILPDSAIAPQGRAIGITIEVQSTGAYVSEGFLELTAEGMTPLADSWLRNGVAATMQDDLPRAAPIAASGTAVMHLDAIPGSLSGSAKVTARLRASRGGAPLSAEATMTVPVYRGTGCACGTDATVAAFLLPALFAVRRRHRR